MQLGRWIGKNVHMVEKGCAKVVPSRGGKKTSMRKRGEELRMRLEREVEGTSCWDFQAVLKISVLGQ